MRIRNISTFVTLALLGLIVGQVTADPSAGNRDAFVEWKVTDLTIQAPLAGLEGDPRRGRTVAITPAKGNCLACHVMPVAEQEFHGTLGPPLDGVASRYTEAQLRLLLVDMKQLNPASMMPSFYKNPADLRRVAKRYQGKTVLTAQEIEDVVAYLTTLK
jgi:sulfur-oxidizing protein SoxX